MGKAKPRHKNRRHKSHQANIPNLEVQEKEESEMAPSSNDEIVIQNVIEELQSSNVEEKLCGLQSLVTLAEKPEILDSVIKYKVLKIAAPLLIDKSSEVRNFTAGLLRNLSASGSVEVCERLVKDDIMTPLLALLHEYNDWNPDSSMAEDKDTLLHVVNTLWNLCETDETALKYLSSTACLSVLLRCLDHRNVGLDLAISVCQCLHSVSEDNPTVISALRSHESHLLGLLAMDCTDNRLQLLKTLAAGIVVNINPLSAWLPSVLAVIHVVLQGDVRGTVGELSSQLPLDSESSLTPDTQAQLESAVALAEAQTTALEILANLITSQDDEMEVESEDSGSEEDEKLNGWTESDDAQPLLALNTEINEGLGKYQLVSTVFSKTQSLPENVMDIIRTCPASRSLAKKTVQLQCRAFLCFNNLASVADMDQLGGPAHLYSLIKHIFSQRFCLNLQHESTSDSNTELLEAATAAIRAILLRLASIKFTIPGDTDSSDLEVLFKIGLCQEPRVQANVIRIVGTLGVLKADENVQLVKMAGNYLLESAEKQQSVWLTAEALDSLMDVFAEDCTDAAASEINLVPRLHALAPRFKTKVRQERRKLGEHYSVASTVVSNIIPFIKYKGARVAALKL